MKAFSEVSKNFLSSLYPKMGECVSIKIAIDEKIDDVTLRYDSYDGLFQDEKMSYLGFKDNAHYYEAKAEIFNSREDLSYYFILYKDGDAFYYSKDGITVFPPRYLSRFIIKPSYEAPSWVSGSTCYQIFPDRFYNGDESNDVKDGEYEFDGAKVQAKSFSDIPEEFEKSRCLDFYNGDLKGVEDKLDYLKELGITMIYLNPIFDSRTVHRYDAVDFFNIDPKLGGNEALISLVNKAHDKGIKIVLDISINHVGTDSIWYKRAIAKKDERKYFSYNEDGSIKYWQGVETLADLNYNSQELKDIIYRRDDSAMKKFIKPPYNIDGWRLDVAPEVARTRDYSLCLDLWRDIRKHLKAVKNDLYLVGEGWDDSYKYIEGEAWDSTMNYFGSGRILRMMMGEEDRYLNDGWGYNPKTRKRINAEEASIAFNSFLKGCPDQSVFFLMNLIDSHDTPRLHNNEKIMDDERYLAVVMALFMLPGFPSVYYGDEVKLDGRIESVEGCRYPMNWNEETQNKKYYNWHKSLAEVRKKNGLGGSAYELEAKGKDVLVIKRYLENETILAALNLSDDDKTFKIDKFMLKGENGKLLVGNGTLNGLDLFLKGRESALFSFA